VETMIQGPSLTIYVPGYSVKIIVILQLQHGTRNADHTDLISTKIYDYSVHLGGIND